MSKVFYYEKGLTDYIRKNNYIPRKNNDLIFNTFSKYYWIDEDTAFKVLDSYLIKDEIYYEIITPKRLYMTLPGINGTVYTIYTNDINELRSIPDIVNYRKPHYGYEIIYWFYYNNIQENNYKYKRMLSYVRYGSKSTINHNKRYIVFGDEYNGSYYNPRFKSVE